MEPTLSLGQDTCRCGRATYHYERHRCAHCGEEGCAECMKFLNVEDSDLNNEWVCVSYDNVCEIEWWEDLKRRTARDHQMIMAWLERGLEAAKMRKGR